MSTTSHVIESGSVARGYTPRELASYLRVGKDKILTWIRRGELGAVLTASNRGGRPRYIILPHHIREWERSRLAGPPPKPSHRRRPANLVDYYPD
jgi:excisionase family DNA binding protein